MRRFLLSVSSIGQNFNPRTHVGCDWWGSYNTFVIPISIHAPMWGATLVGFLQHIYHPYFNPRTHVGCDDWRCKDTYTYDYFNPRTHVGCDRHRTVYLRRRDEISIHAPMWGATLVMFLIYSCPLISIHAPMWGATLYFVLICLYFLYFNPRTHVGCDSSKLSEDNKLVFQSTHPCGVRPSSSTFLGSST